MMWNACLLRVQIRHRLTHYKTSNKIIKPVCSNNVTKRHGQNTSSVNQLVKTFNVTKSICSSNGSNYVICNSTCNLVSNFASDCQSVKPVCKLLDVNWKRRRERLVNNKSSHQHDLQNHLVPWIFWWCPYIFMN